MTAQYDYALNAFYHLSPPERTRLIARLIAELVEQEDVTPASPIADLWKTFDADRAGWLGERTASDELTASRR